MRGGFLVDCGWTGLTIGEASAIDVGGRRNKMGERERVVVEKVGLGY